LEKERKEREGEAVFGLRSGFFPSIEFEEDVLSNDKGSCRIGKGRVVEVVHQYSLGDLLGSMDQS